MSASRHLLKTKALLRHLWHALGTIAVRPPYRLSVFALLTLAATWVLLSHAGGVNDFRDAQFHGHYEAFAAASIARFHQAPLWDPYYCGGMYLLGAPQTRFVSPTLLLTLIFGETRGEAVTAFVMIVTGLEGTFRYTRSRGAGQRGALLAAPMFGLMGMFAFVARLGWMNFYTFELLPWAAYGLGRAMRGDAIGVAIGAVALAWCVGMGGTYAAPMAALWCAFEVVEAILKGLVRRDRRRVVLTIGGALSLASLALGLSVLHLWPVVVTMRDAPRIIGGAPGNKLVDAIGMVLKPHGDGDDGTFFVGAFALPAILLGLGRRRSVAPAIGLLLSVWMALGYAVQPSLFAAMRALPVYETLRYPERFFILAALFGSVLAARGVTTLHALVRSRTLRIRRPRMHAAAQAALLVGALGLAIDVGPLVAQHVLHAGLRETVAPPSTALADRPFHQARGNRWALAYYEPMNRGSLSCYEAYPVPQSPKLRGDLPSEQYLLDPAAGTVAERRWSPNAMDVDASLVKATRLVVNQNFHSGWRSNVGQVVSEQGLLAVDLPEGEHHVQLTFSPPSARAGLVVTLTSLAALIAMLALRRRGERMTAAIACVPSVAAALFLHEPPSPPRDLRAPDGGPLVVEQPPDGARGVGVKFEAGVSLEAVSLSETNPVAGREILAEFDWKRAPDVERGLGVFVHFVPEGDGDTKNGDHVLLSGVIELENAPPGKTLRDVLPVTFPDHNKTYKIWVGLWRIRRDASRVGVVDKGSATVNDNCVLAGRVTVR